MSRGFIRSLWIIGTVILTASAVYCVLEYNFYSQARLNVSDRAQVLQDADSKVAYYLESDRCHVAAVSPDGKLLWRSEVASKERHESIASLSLKDTWYGMPKGEKCIQAVILLGNAISPDAYGSMMKMLSTKDGAVVSQVVE